MSITTTYEITDHYIYFRVKVNDEEELYMKRVYVLILVLLAATDELKIWHRPED